jgi:hypothetical protein
LRAICKLLLNSIWGKLAELLNKLKFKVIADTNEWFELIANYQYIVERFDFSNNISKFITKTKVQLTRNQLRLTLQLQASSQHMAV